MGSSHAYERTSVLLVSRRSDIADSAVIQTVGALPPKAARSLLRRAVEQSRKHDADLLTEVAGWVAGCPLAVRLLEGAIRTVTDGNLRQWLTSEQPAIETLTDFAKYIARDFGDPSGFPLLGTLNHSFQILPKEARLLLHGLGLLGNVPIPIEMVDAIGGELFSQSSSPQLMAERAKTILFNRALLEHVSGADFAMASVHKLVAEAIRAFLSDEEELVWIVICCMNSSNNQFFERRDLSGSRHSELQLAMVPHYQELLRRMRKMPNLFAQQIAQVDLRKSLAMTYIAHAKLDEARSLLQEALTWTELESTKEVYRAFQGDVLSSRSAIYGLLAIIESRGARWKEALRLEELALAAVLKATDRDDELVATVRRHLADYQAAVKIDDGMIRLIQTARSNNSMGFCFVVEKLLKMIPELSEGQGGVVNAHTLFVRPGYFKAITFGITAGCLKMVTLLSREITRRVNPAAFQQFRMDEPS